MRDDYERFAEISLSDLSILVSVAEAGSFRRAAERRKVGQSAISRRVQRLEDILGISLFERHASGAKMTPAGVRILSDVRVITEQCSALFEKARSLGVAESGHLRAGIIASLSQGVIRSLVETFKAKHPGVTLEIGELARSELLTRLSHREIDLILAAGYPEDEYGEAILLHQEQLFLAVAADGHFAGYKRLSWTSASSETFVVSAHEPGPEIHDYITRAATDLGRKVVVRRLDLGREGIMNLVGLGFGVSLVADHWRGVQYPNVEFIPIGDEEETIPFSITWRQENDNPALRRFISLARIEAKRNGALS